VGQRTLGWRAAVMGAGGGEATVAHLRATLHAAAEDFDELADTAHEYVVDMHLDQLRQVPPPSCPLPQMCLESRRFESRPKAARLGLEASAGWASASSRGLWRRSAAFHPAPILVARAKPYSQPNESLHAPPSGGDGGGGGRRVVVAPPAAAVDCGTRAGCQCRHPRVADAAGRHSPRAGTRVRHGGNTLASLSLPGSEAGGGTV
jgi:hypothetical protein